MNKFLTRAVLGATLAATALTAAAPAEARHYGRRGNDGAGVAVVAGILGLGIGAAIASSSDRDHRYDRRDRYYRDQSYDGYPDNYDYRDSYDRSDRRGYYDDNNGYYDRNGYGRR